MHLFAVLPPRLGGLDMLLPLFTEIKHVRPQTKVTLLFVEERVYHDLHRDRFLSAEVARVVDSERRLRKNGGGLVDVLMAGPAFLHTLTEIATARDPILLHSRGTDSPLVKLLCAAVKLKGGAIYQHFAGMPLTMGRLAAGPGRRGNEGKAFLCFSDHDVEFLRNAGYDRLIPIGYPRLYPTWIDRIRQVADELVASECRTLGMSASDGHLAVFLGSMVEGLYPEAELADWVRDVIATAQARLPGVPVLIKPHPMEKPYVLEMIEDIIRDVPSAGLTHLHPSVLASSARLVVAHHTSTIIDALAMGAPTIQFQELTPHWLERHPEGSSFLRLGPLWARNREELEARFVEALSRDYVVPDVRGPLKHSKDLSVLLEESESGS